MRDPSGIRRRAQVLGLFVLGMSAAASGAAGEAAIAYLESVKGRADTYMAPSEIDPRFTTAFYVNVATKGSHKQRMWVLHREGIGGAWRLGMWDKAHWKTAKQGDDPEPSYSWPISSGRYYRGDRRSGPTPPGIYGLDERKWRYGRGWLQAGMVHVMHIDYHYSSGRVSGIAFHGTTRGRYRRLGANDSHGCIRMRQDNALALIDRITGKDGILPDELRWGEVPRFWLSEQGRVRRGYVRDGILLDVDALPDTEKSDGSIRWPVVAAPTQAGVKVDDGVLTKSGFRVIVVIFKD